MKFPVGNINAHVIKLVQNTVRKYASTEIVDFDEICSGLGLDVKEGPLPLGTDGAIEDKTILINSQIQNADRKRFTQFHEVTHYLLNEDGELISMLHDATWNQNGEAKRQLVERFCNVGAAEFLMPRKKFTEIFKEKGFNVELIPFAANHFGSSTIATTIQLAQIASNSCITAICEYGLSPKKTAPSQDRLFDEEESIPKPKLHVVYSAASPATKYWLARGTNIPNDHLINQAFLEAQPVEGESYVPFRSGNRMPCYCEALPDKDKDRVYVLFNLTPRPNPNPNQLNLF